MTSDPRRNSAATVLVVDDQNAVRLLMCKALESAGFRVLESDNGGDALNLFRRADPPVDLLVTDYRMPGMSGLELARECCSIDGELGVLYISGSSPGDDLRADLAAGRRGFLAKPFRHADLLSSVKEVLDMQPIAAPSRETQAPRMEQSSMER